MNNLMKNKKGFFIPLIIVLALLIILIVVAWLFTNKLKEALGSGTFMAIIIGVVVILLWKWIAPVLTSLVGWLK